MKTRHESGQLAHLRILVLTAWLLLALPTTAAADQAVGRVISTVGEVVAVRPDDTERPLGRHDEIFAGDTIHTGRRGRAQIRFIDEGLVDLRPLSTFEIERYEEPAPEPEQEEERGGSAIMNFVRGAMRTITGRIGRDPDDEYQMRGPVATVGIRGTDYSLQFCDADCAEEGRPEGLYGRVDDGDIIVSNQAGMGEFGEGDYFYVADEDSLPQQLLTPPPSILDGNDDGDTEDDDDDDDDDVDEDVAIIREADDDDDVLDDDIIDTRFIAGDDDPEPETEPVVDRVMAGGYLGSFGGGLIRDYEGGTGDFTTETVEVAIPNGITETEAVTSATFEDGTEVTVDTDIAELFNPGAEFFDDGSEVYWGMWEENAPYGGITASIDGDSTNLSNFAFMFSDDVTTPTQLGDLSGTANFGSPDGPGLLSSLENSWAIGSMDLTVDFADIAAGFDTVLIGPGSTADMLIDAGTDGLVSVSSLNLLELEFDGTWDDVDAVGDGIVEGSLSGQFVGTTADGIIISLSVERLDDGIVVEEIIGTILLTQ